MSVCEILELSHVFCSSVLASLYNFVGVLVDCIQRFIALIVGLSKYLADPLFQLKVLIDHDVVPTINHNIHSISV